MINTRVLRLEGEEYVQRAQLSPSNALCVKEAAAALSDGKLVAFPTETVYGLGANANDEEAIARIYEVKQRPREKQLSLLICCLDVVESRVRVIPPKARVLMEKFWPGPLTLVLSGIEGEEVGLRFPANNVAQEIVRLAGVPVAATSANVSGMPPPVSAEQVIRVLGGRVELVLDGGVTHFQAPSTVVRVSSADEVEIIRVGVIPMEIINDCFKQERVIKGL